MTAPQPFRPPKSPATAFAWAGAWLFVSIVSGVVLVLDAVAILGFDLYGQRSEAFLITTPVIALVIAVLLVVVGVRRGPPWSQYVAATTPQQRRFHSDALLVGEVWAPVLAIAIVLGVVWLAGATSVAIFLPNLAANLTGLLLAIVFLMLLAMAWVSLLSVAVRRKAASDRAATGSR